MFSDGVVIPCEYKFPTEKQINLKLEEIGYNGYLPNRLLNDLVYMYAYLMKNRKVKYRRPINEYEQQVIEFLKSIPTDYIIGKSPLEKAIITLKQFAGKVSYRDIEKSVIVNVKNKTENAKLESSSIEKYNIDEEDISDELIDILELSELLTNFISDDVILTDKIQQRTIKNFGELLKVKTTELARPDMKIKLLNKSLLVNSSDFSDICKRIVFIEDVSSSLETFQKKIRSVYYALSLLGNPIRYYQVYKDNLNDMGKLSPEEFKTLHVTRYKGDFNISNIINELQHVYQHDNVIFVVLTDNYHYLRRSVEATKQWNFIFVGGLNQSLNVFSKKSGGKTIVI